MYAPAAKALKVDRSTLWRWVKEDIELQEAVKQAKESIIDLAESKLMQNIQAGDNASIFFFLKTQAKDRGYIEKQVIHNEGEQTINLIRTVVK